MREVVTGTARGGNAERETFGQPHVFQTGGGADQRVAVWCVADRAVEIVFQAGFFARWHAVDHGHVLAFDPFQIKREKVGAKAVGYAVFEAGGGVAFVCAEDPAASFFAYI